MAARAGMPDNASIRLRCVPLVIIACTSSPCLADLAAPLPHLFFMGLEGSFDGAYVSAGADMLVNSSTGPGTAVVRVTTGSGFSRFPTDPRHGYAFQFEVKQSARFLYGWRQSGWWGVATLFGGLAVENRYMLPRIPDPQTGYRLGPAMVFDAWLKPMERLAVQVYAEVAMPYRAASLRVAPGYEVTDGVFIGPELGIGLHHGTMRSRAGLHVTGLKLWDVGLRISAGYAQDRGGRGGAYGTLSLWRHY